MATRRHPTKQHTRSMARGGHGSSSQLHSSADNPYIPVMIFIGIFLFLATVLALKIYNQA